MIRARGCVALSVALLTCGCASPAYSDLEGGGAAEEPYVPPQNRCALDPEGERRAGEPRLTIDCAFSRESCAAPADDEARLPGPFTITAQVILDERPVGRAAVISRWETGAEQRAFELGVDESQQVYLVLSEDGEWTSESALEVRGAGQLRRGRAYEIAARVAPGEPVSLYVDGVSEQRSDVWLPRAHVGSASLSIGRRSGDGSARFPGRIGEVHVFDRSLDDDEIEALASGRGHCEGSRAPPVARAITRGPRQHWFGYYDKHQFDPTDRYVLGMSVDFDGRAPTADDVIEIGMVDLEDGDRWIPLGESRAWGWQQGCMLQWLPGSDHEIIWNDREGDGEQARFVARILNVRTGALRTIPHPVYTVAPDGRTALGLDFHRLERMRPGYGYQGIPDPRAEVNAPDDAGIYRIDLETGTSTLIISYADLAAVPGADGPVDDLKHWVNVLLFNETGRRFLFVNRWYPPDDPFRTRLFTADADGDELFLLSEEDHLSHVDWRGDRDVVVYSQSFGGYAQLADQSRDTSVLLGFSRDGHQSMMAGGEWMLSDTYPDFERFQNPFLYHLPTDQIVSLGYFAVPDAYVGSVRCDTHPRISRDGRRVVIDSAHEGGRQMYLIEVGELQDRIAGPR